MASIRINPMQQAFAEIDLLPGNIKQVAKSAFSISCIPPLETQINSFSFSFHMVNGFFFAHDK